MKQIIFYIVIICFILLSCKNSGKQNNKLSVNISSVSDTLPVSTALRDTTITFDIEDTNIKGTETVITYDIWRMSSEGPSAAVTYEQGQIDKCVIYIFGCNGQTKLTYTFHNNRINVTEKDYRYKSILVTDDMKLSENISYSIDYDGNPIMKTDSNRIDIFQEFKRAVPFSLK
jgi:hypothetical protein